MPSLWGDYMSTGVLSWGEIMSTEIVVDEKAIMGMKPKQDISELLKDIRPVDRVDKVLIILLDCSGSMNDRWELSRKIDLAWHCLQKELSPNMSGWTYGIIKFGNNTDWEIRPTNDISILMQMKKPEAHGTTSMLMALKEAWFWVGSYANQARFILISDGCPTDAFPEVILSEAGNYHSIPIDTISVGSDTFDEKFLTGLSEITGGIFCRAHSVELLALNIYQLSPNQRPLFGNT